MIKKCLLILFAFTILVSFSSRHSDNYVTESSTVLFLSSASFGKIKGVSEKMTGSMNIKKRSFEFQLPACSFQGFFNATQKAHYCEKFVEGPKYPDMGFKGKIIEDIDLSVPGIYKVRGKGMFLLHGVEKERIIDVLLTVKEGQILVDSKFIVPVEEYGIKVSKMNSLSMSKLIDVAVKIVMKPS